MHLLVDVVCGDRISSFKIPVGDGQKTFKWLGLVCATRFATAPRGQQRVRESRMAQSAGASFVPSGITTKEVGFFHPDALIAEQLGDGDRVEVTVQPRVAVGAAGQAVRTRWATIAFELSGPRAGARDAALKEVYAEQDARRSAADAEEAERVRALLARKAGRVREIIATQLADERAVREAMHEDWYAMSKNRVLESMVPVREEQQKIKELITQNYVQLDELFKTYAASGSSMATAHVMEYSEFCEFVHAAAVVAEGPLHSGVMFACFQESAGNFSHAQHKAKAAPGAGPRKTAQSTLETTQLERADFINAMLWFALYAATAPGGHESLMTAQLHRTASDLHTNTTSGGFLSKFEKLTNPSRLFEQLILEKLLPLIAKKLPGSLGKMALASNEVLAVFFDHEQALREVFDAHAEPDTDDAEGEVTISEFVAMIEQAGLVKRAATAHAHANADQGGAAAGGTGGSIEESTLTLKDVRQAFAASQSEVPFRSSDDTAKVGVRASTHQNQLMSFAEFLEALARVGLTKWSGSDLATAPAENAYRVERAVLAVTSKHKHK